MAIATLTSLLIAGLVSAGIGAAASLGSSAINAASQNSANEENKKLVQETNQANLAATQQTNAANLQLAREDRDFQLMMSNTAHQREVADLKAAGLNPVLSAGGNGSPVVSVNTANQQAARFQAAQVNPVGFDLSGVGSAAQSITNLLLVSKMLGTTGYQKYYLGMNSAGKISALLGKIAR